MQILPNSSSSDFVALPLELFVYIISYINDYPTLVRLALSCRAFYDLLLRRNKDKSPAVTSHVEATFNNLESYRFHKHPHYATCDQAQLLIDGPVIKLGGMDGEVMVRITCDLMEGVNPARGEWMACYACRTVKRSGCFDHMLRMVPLPPSTMYEWAFKSHNPYLERMCRECSQKSS